jgi:hypothetical protein
MTRITGMLSIAFMVLFSGMSAFPDEGRTIASYTYYLLAEDSDAAIANLRHYAPSKNGYVSYFSSDRIVMRMPGAEIMTFKKRLAELGYVTDEQQSRQDFSSVMLDLETRLNVKQKLLGDLTAIFSGAQLADTLKVEQAIGAVIVEIEDLKGKIGYYRDRFALSDVTVHVNRSAAQGSAHRGTLVWWDWIRGLGIENLLRN